MYLLFAGVVGILIIIWLFWYLFDRKKQSEGVGIGKKTTTNIKLKLDPESINLHNWFQQDDPKFIQMAFATSIDKNSSFDDIQNLPNKYQGLCFSGDKNSSQYFRRGKITRIDRFTAVKRTIENEEIEIGHIESIFVESPQLIEYNKNNKNNINSDCNKNIVGWIFAVYIGSNQRGNGYGKDMCMECIKHFHNNNIYDIYLDVFHDNIAAIKTYTKCGFKVIEKTIIWGKKQSLIMKWFK